MKWLVHLLLLLVCAQHAVDLVADVLSDLLHPLGAGADDEAGFVCAGIWNHFCIYAYVHAAVQSSTPWTHGRYKLTPRNCPEGEVQFCSADAHDRRLRDRILYLAESMAARVAGTSVGLLACYGAYAMIAGELSACLPRSPPPQLTSLRRSGQSAM